MFKKKQNVAFILGLLLFLSQGCSSSSSSSTSATPSLDNLNDIPTLNVSSYDFSSGSTSESNAKLSTKAIAGGPSVGDFSRAGCESYTLKRQLKQDARQIDSFLCYIKKIESSSENMTIPTDSYNYYEMTFPESQEQHGPPPNVRIRIGKFADQLRMDACIPINGEYQHEVEFRLTASSTGYVGYVINEYQFQEGQESFQGNSKIEVDITGSSADDFTSAQFNAYHRDQDGQGNGWQSLMTFTADAASLSNTLSGANAYQSTQWGSNSAQLYGQWGSDQIGSVQFAVSGEYDPPSEEDCQQWGVPSEHISFCANKCYNENGQEVAANSNGKCEFVFSGTESFNIDNSSTPPSFTIVDDSSSSYYEGVSAQTLPELSDIESAVAFVNAWDCSSEGEFVAFDGTSIPGLLDCESDRDEELWRLCEEQDRGSQHNE